MSNVSVPSGLRGRVTTAIVDAAAVVFAQRDDIASMNEVTSAARVARATLGMSGGRRAGAD